MSKPQLRLNQVTSTFGPGAMVDLPDASVIIAGLDEWRYDINNIPIIEEPRLVAKLEHILNVTGLSLRTPPPSPEQDYGATPNITAWRFPEWFIVQKTVLSGHGFHKRRLVHLNTLTALKYVDPDSHKKRSVVPVRFVRGCRRGHLGDIDWPSFVHGVHNECQRDLWMEERGTSGDLDEVWVICDCGAQRAMSQAARMELRALGSCNGSRPWLGAGSREHCGDENRLLIRSASNAYFPQLMTVISIPDSRGPLDEAVHSLWDNFLSDVVDALELTRVRRKPAVTSRLQNYTDDEILDAIQRHRAGASEVDRPVKEVEFEALAAAHDELGADVPEGDFFARKLPEAYWADAEWMNSVERVVLVHRLREVRALVGFTRFEAAGPDIEGELSLDVERARLGLDTSWLPASENRGEGIFLVFKTDAVAKWLNHPAVVTRAHQLADGFNLWKKDHPSSTRTFPKIPYYLVHSISHLLITAISLECGYPASSLRERIYAFNDHYGLLIYTGSSDAEGTLGGLIVAGRNIKRHMQNALEIGMLCSNDPVCAYHRPSEQDHQSLLGSACHGCLLISETSCEQQNDFLDRALVVQTVEALGAEFFADFA